MATGLLLTNLNKKKLGNPGKSAAVYLAVSILQQK